MESVKTEILRGTTLFILGIIGAAGQAFIGTVVWDWIAVGIYDVTPIGFFPAFAALIAVSPLVSSYNHLINEMDTEELLKYWLKDAIIGPLTGLGLCWLILMIFVW